MSDQRLGTLQPATLHEELLEHSKPHLEPVAGVETALLDHDRLMDHLGDRFWLGRGSEPGSEDLPIPPHHLHVGRGLVEARRFG